MTSSISSKVVLLLYCLLSRFQCNRLLPFWTVSQVMLTILQLHSYSVTSSIVSSRNRRYEQEIAGLLWKIYPADIQGLTPGADKSGSRVSTAEWYITNAMVRKRISLFISHCFWTQNADELWSKAIHTNIVMSASGNYPFCVLEEISHRRYASHFY